MLRATKLHSGRIVVQTGLSAMLVAQDEENGLCLIPTSDMSDAEWLDFSAQCRALSAERVSANRAVVSDSKEQVISMKKTSGPVGVISGDGYTAPLTLEQVKTLKYQWIQDWEEYVDYDSHFGDGDMAILVRLTYVRGNKPYAYISVGDAQLEWTITVEEAQGIIKNSGETWRI